MNAENDDLKLQLSIVDCVNNSKQTSSISVEILSDKVLHLDRLQRKIKDERQKQMELDCEVLKKCISRVFRFTTLKSK